MGYVCYLRAFSLSRTFTHACVLLFSMSADIFKNKRFARDVETKRVFRPPDFLRFWMDVVGYAGDLLGVGKHQSGIRMPLSCVFCSCKTSITMFRTCCCILKIGVSLETSRPNAFSDLQIFSRFLIHAAGYAVDLLRVGKRESGIHMLFPWFCICHARIDDHISFLQ